MEQYDIPKDSEEIINKISQNVFSMALKTQVLNHIYGTEERPILPNSFLTLSGTERDSYIIHDLNYNTVRLNSKINHLTLRNCENTDVYINSCISGIDLILCRNIRVMIDSLPYIEIYSCSRIEIFTLELQRLRIFHSVDISVNESDLLINPFKNYSFPETIENGDIKISIIN